MNGKVCPNFWVVLYLSADIVPSLKFCYLQYPNDDDNVALTSIFMSANSLLSNSASMSLGYMTTCSQVLWKLIEPGSVTGLALAGVFTPCWAQVFIRPATPRFILTDSELKYNVELGAVLLNEFLSNLWSTKNGSNCTIIANATAQTLSDCRDIILDSNLVLTLI